MKGILFVPNATRFGLKVVIHIVAYANVAWILATTSKVVIQTIIVQNTYVSIPVVI